MIQKRKEGVCGGALLSFFARSFPENFLRLTSKDATETCSPCCSAATLRLMLKLAQRVRRRVYSELNVRVHGDIRGFVHVAPEMIVDEGWQDAPIHPPDVLEGDPRARNYPLAMSRDGGTSVGLWHCTAGRFNWLFHFDEVIRILEGEVLITVAGRQHHLRAGSVAFFAVGTPTQWVIPEQLLKHYVHRHPSPILGRWLGLKK
jgi:uncharacterized cupin superfamily protein